LFVLVIAIVFDIIWVILLYTQPSGYPDGLFAVVSVVGGAALLWSGILQYRDGLKTPPPEGDTMHSGSDRVGQADRKPRKALPRQVVSDE
jgi:threonine/homoserine/homoserine lactone efflux protein